MSIIEEQFSSREFSSAKDGLSLRRVYHVYVSDPVEAASYGPQYGDQYFGDGGGSEDAYNLFVSSISTRPLEAMNCIELIAEYKSPSPGSGSGALHVEVWQTDASGESVRIEAVDTDADRTDAQIKVDDLARFRAEVGLSIGKKQDGTIDGVDILAPVVAVSCTTWKTVAEVTNAYKRTVYDLVGKVNTNAFREWEAGEVRFDGVSIRETEGEDLVELNFKFSCRANKTALPFTIVPTIESGTTYRPDISVTLDKLGWQYLWKQIGDVAAYNGVGQPPKQRQGATIAVVADTVYRTASLAALGIGA